MVYLLGIDIGTSGTKTVLFDKNGAVIASSTFEYPLYQPNIGWAEQEPEDWWKATCSTIKSVLSESGINPGDIKGIGLSGQMHGIVLLDEEGRVLRRSIIWCDQRTERECALITDLIGRERLVNITANPALTGFSAAKIMWVKSNEPDIFKKTAKILLPKDYIRFRLTGEYATEVSDASGMQLMDVPARNWSNEILDKLGIERRQLGGMFESQEVSGRVNHAGAAQTGLREGTPVAGGAGDQAAGAVGNGIVKPGVISSTIGTSGVVFAYSDKISIDPAGRVHTLCHAVPNTWHIMGVTQSAGLSLKWFRDNFCAEEKSVAAQLDTDPYVLMDKEAEKAALGCNGLIFLPYLMGERSPHLDSAAKGVFFGLSAKHEKRDMLRAVMEGVVYSLKDCLEIIREMGVEISEVRASGGGGRSPFWRQMQADVFRAAVTVTNSSEGSALGAALLAGVGTGLYKSVAEACDTAIQVRNRLEPVPGKHKEYMKYYGIYRRLYNSLKQDYRELACILEK